MTNPAMTTPNRSVLVIGASRGLGEALVETYVDRGAQVVGTVRGDAPTALQDFARGAEGRVEVERVDVTDPAELSALALRLSGRSFDLLFVVAGISTAPREEVGADIATDAFEHMMTTNVLGVMRAVETLQHLVASDGTIAVMTSGQGSITNNTSGGFEVYRATKAALNQMMRSYAARHDGEDRALLLMAPGWVRTAMGGPGAGLDVSESIPPLVTTVDAQRGTPGLRYLDRNGSAIPW